MAEKLVLIDGYSILHRAYYGIRDLTNREGLHTNAIYGFLNMMFRITESTSPDYLAVAFDVHAPTFRHKMYEAYKGTRKPMDPELREQIPVMRELLDAMEIPVFSMEGYEADDILGTLARKGEAAGMEVYLVSGDRDLLQIATDKTRIVIPKTKKGQTVIETYDAQGVMDLYGVTPEEFIDVKALMGDSSDNIPGVTGIGEKGATKLIAAYHSLENVYAHLEEMPQNKTRTCLENGRESAELSKTLAKICTEVPVAVDFADLKVTDVYTPAAYDLMKRLEFKKFLERFSEDKKEVSFEEPHVLIGDSPLALLGWTPVNEGDVLALYPVEDHRRVIGVGMWYGAAKPAMRTETDGTFAYLSCLGQEEEAADLLAENIRRAGTVCCADTKILLHFLGQDRVTALAECFGVDKWQDVTLGAYLLSPIRSSYAYDVLAQEFAGRFLPAREEYLAKIDHAKASEKAPEKLAQYGAVAAWGMALASDGILEGLRETGQTDIYTGMEHPLLFTLYHMECEGIRVLPEELKAYGDSLKERILAREQEIYAECGETFNINSPKQLGEVLFDRMGLPSSKKTKTGYSTASDVLEKLAPEYPVVAKILDYRTVSKLYSTYAEGLQAFIDEDHRIRPTFCQTVTATGRLSCVDPNLQNIPIRMEEGRQIRRVFVPAEGAIFVDADYSQIELRILAHISGDENLIAAYNRAEDIHRMTASQVFHIPYEEVDDLHRRNAKAVNFGIVYGISSFGLSQDLSISRKEASAYIERYFETYPAIKQFLDGSVAFAKENGYVRTIYGRRRPVPELSSSNFMTRQFGERVAMNSPIQGTAADIIKIAMLRVDDRLRRDCPQAKLILQVHDELLVEAPREDEETVRRILREEMEQAADLKVKLEVDIHSGATWYEAK